MKDRTQKTTDEMDFNEFVSWATGHVIFGIAEGRKLRDLIHFVVAASCRNEVFGASKKSIGKKS